MTICCSLAVFGCTATQIEAYINLAAQIALNALTIASAFSATPVSAHDTALVSQFATVLQNSVASFTADKAAGNSALVSVAEAAQTNIPAFLAAAQFDNPQLAARVEAAATSFLTIVESIAVIVQPNVVVPPAPAPVALARGRLYGVPARVMVPRKQIVAQWNAVVCQGASSACVVH